MDQRGADSSSLTSVETMPSPKTEVRHRKLSRRRSSPHELRTTEDESDADFSNNQHDSGFHGENDYTGNHIFFIDTLQIVLQSEREKRDSYSN